MGFPYMYLQCIRESKNSLIRGMSRTSKMRECARVLCCVRETVFTMMIKSLFRGVGGKGKVRAGKKGK